MSLNPKPKILYVDDEKENLEVFQLMFHYDYHILTCTSGKEAIDLIKNEQKKNDPVQLILSDQRMPEMTGIELLEKINIDYPEVSKVLVTGYGDLEIVIKAINKAQIFRYISKPWDEEEVRGCINKALEVFKLKEENKALITKLRRANVYLKKTNDELENKNNRLQEALEEIEKLKDALESENEYLRQEVNPLKGFGNVITASPLMENIMKQVIQVAKTNSTVLVTGETGTGKEVIARSIHEMSYRSGHNMVKVNCAALPSNLIESELFGHEKGAFTGAINRKIGRFELADQSTLFLDEIGELPLELQAKLLRALQEGEIERLGGTTPIIVDVRIIAATNRDLEEEIKKGQFRADLYYRLNVFPISLPKLSERKEDIPLLADFFTRKFSEAASKPLPTLTKKVVNQLIHYQWPGNIRELQNVIERAVVLTKGKKLELGKWFSDYDVHQPEISESGFLTLEEQEARHIIKALEITHGKISGKNGAAELLDINYSTLRSRMKKLGIDPVQYASSNGSTH